MESLISRHPFRSSKEYNKRFKRVNHHHYGFLCDPKKRSNPSNFRMKFNEIETPLSATIIFKANDGFELCQDDFGRFHFEAIGDFSNGYFTFKMITDRVQATYFNWNDQVYNAGCTLFLEELGKGKEVMEEDERIFLKFSNNQKFWNLLRNSKSPQKPQILEFEESDLKVLYAIRDSEINDFVIFAKNLKSGLVEKFLYNTSSHGFERVNTGLAYDSKNDLPNGKLSLLFMTYDRSEGDVQTLTVYRTANGDVEKKILKGGKFEVIPIKPIVSREEMVEKEDFREEIDNGFEIVGR
ncbi:hypothetical protein CAEBREN_12845 [Caenorhabditis brenneri]|uniref:Uncharacterized protein n=1 Tax=Caenorhabditis brenneri TaxID=135651 RepID=G0MJN7_CAEBE|nr:hypothetical protein CAEBREN_12845 [Caenorhabditis brenneri]